MGAPTCPVTSAPGTCGTRTCRHSWGSGRVCSRTSSPRTASPCGSSQPANPPPTRGPFVQAAGPGLRGRDVQLGLARAGGPPPAAAPLAVPGAAGGWREELHGSFGAPPVVSSCAPWDPWPPHECHGSLGVWSELHVVRFPQGSARGQSARLEVSALSFHPELQGRDNPRSCDHCPPLAPWGCSGSGLGSSQFAPWGGPPGPSGA